MSRKDFVNKLKIPDHISPSEKDNGNIKTYKKGDKVIYTVEKIEYENRIEEIKTAFDGDTIYKEHTVKEGENTSKTVSEERNGIIVGKYKQYIKTLSNGQIVYSKTITYECDGKTSNKISSIEYKRKKNRYKKMYWIDIIKCPHNDTYIVISYSPYRIRSEPPGIEHVVKCDYDVLDNSSIDLPNFTIMPSYEANSVEYNWAQTVLKEKQEEYEALLSYKER